MPRVNISQMLVEDSSLLDYLDQNVAVRLPCQAYLASDTLGILVKASVYPLIVNSPVYFKLHHLKNYSDYYLSQICFKGVELVKVDLPESQIVVRCQATREVKLTITNTEQLQDFFLTLMWMPAMELLTDKINELELLGGAKFTWMSRAFDLMGREWPMYLISKRYLKYASTGFTLDQQELKSKILRKVVLEMIVEYEAKLETIKHHLIDYNIRFDPKYHGEVLFGFKRLLETRGLMVNKHGDLVKSGFLPACANWIYENIIPSFYKAIFEAPYL